MVTDNGLWIKDELDKVWSKIINADRIVIITALMLISI